MKQVENPLVVEVISTRDRLLMARYGAGFLFARFKIRQKHEILSNLPLAKNS